VRGGFFLSAVSIGSRDKTRKFRRRKRRGAPRRRSTVGWFFFFSPSAASSGCPPTAQELQTSISLHSYAPKKQQVGAGPKMAVFSVDCGLLFSFCFSQWPSGQWLPVHIATLSKVSYANHSSHVIPSDNSVDTGQCNRCSRKYC
jgi:hypothetical protein